MTQIVHDRRPGAGRADWTVTQDRIDAPVTAYPAKPDLLARRPGPAALARADQHAHRADPALPARRRGDPGLAAAADERSTPTCRWSSPTTQHHPTLAPLLNDDRRLQRLLVAVVLGDLPAAVHLAGRLPASRGCGSTTRRCAGCRRTRRPACTGCRSTPRRSRSREAARGRRLAVARRAARRAATAPWCARTPDGSVTVSAEKGYLKEAGNLLFHFSLMAILVGVAFGSWYGWQADRILVAGADTAFCNTPSQLDDLHLGARVTGVDAGAVLPHARPVRRDLRRRAGSR